MSIWDWGWGWGRLMTIIFTCYHLQLMNPAQLEAENFDLPLYLQALCKKQQFYEDEEEREKPEIDFISLQKDLKRIQGIQERTCEQIVEFVDQHRQRFMQINDQLDLISDKVKRSQVILKLLSSQIDDYKSGCYLNESKIQRFITDYELRLMQDQILASARSEALFLMKFNSQFEGITNKEIGSLNLTQKYLISRFTFKLQYLQSLYSHQIVNEYIPDTLQILEIITNISEEFEFYLSEQLAKYQNLLSLAREEEESGRISGILNQIKAWYMNINKKEEYYKVLEKNTIEKEMQAGEKVLLANKTALLSGKDQQIIETVFFKIFSALRQFPENYPRERLVSLLLSFFKKDELKFFYTYAMPIFPLAYTSYLLALQSAKVQEWLKTQLKESHGWNLKMWVMVREKNILDRSNNDSDLLKWIEIIFKQACMLPGTLTDFLKLAFKLVNRYLDKTGKAGFLPATFNRLVEQHQKVGAVIAQKILEHSKDSESLARKIQQSLNKSFQTVIKDLLNKNLQNVASTCQNFLEPVKSFVSKIIKKDKDFVQNNTVNKHENLFKPLHAFIRNNAELSAEALQFITDSVQSIVIKYYDSRYAPEIYNYSKDQLISEQVSMVMEVVGRERTTIFKRNEEEK